MDVIKTGFGTRNDKRMVTWEKATEALVQHYVLLGDSQEVAEGKVKELGTELFDNHLSATMKYWFGVGKQPLIDAVNASVLVHMDGPAKLIATNILNLIV